MGDESQREQLRAALGPWLAGREVVHWVGQPCPRRFRWEMSGELLLGLIGVLAGAFALLLIVGSLISRWSWELVPALLAPGIFLAIGHYHLGAPWRYRQALGRAVYAVTSDRAILLNGFGYSGKRNLCTLAEPDQSFNRAEIRRRIVKRRRRDGSGDIIFDIEWHLSGRRRHWVEVGFFGVADVASVEALFDQINSPSPGKMSTRSETSPDVAL